MSRVFLVTGANKGIGYEAVKYIALKQPNDIVLLASRSVQNGEDAIKKMKASDSSHSFSNVHVLELDITSEKSLQAAVEHVKSKYGKVTDLLHNSGISSFNGEANSPEVLYVNVKGARDTIEAFLPLIPAKTGRIALVSSEVGAWYIDGAESSLRAKLDDVEHNDWNTVEGYMNDWIAKSQGKESKLPWATPDNMMTQAYCASKGLVTTWARNFALKHPDTPLAIVCPGYCATDLNHNSGFRPASMGGESVAWPFFNDYKSGHFYQDGKDLPIAFPISQEFMAQIAKQQQEREQQQ